MGTLCAWRSSAQKITRRSIPMKRRTTFSMYSPSQFGALAACVNENANLYHSELPLHPSVSCAAANEPVWYAMHAPANSGETRSQASTVPSLSQENAEAAAYGLR